MTIQTLLREAVKGSPVKTGENRWRVIVAKPGVGSSGTYSAEVFKRDALKMIPPGAQSFFNHDDKRDPRDMLGYFPDGAMWSEEDQAVVAELSVFENWKPLVEQLAPHVGISLYAMGEKDEEGNVTGFIEDAYNGADLVSRPGLAGAGFDQKLYEAAIAASASSTPTLVGEEGKDNKMEEIKDLTAKVEALASAVDTLVSAQTAKTTEDAQVKADEKAVEEKLATITANLDAVEAAREDLLPSQVEALRNKAKSGVDVAPLIEEYKAMVTEARTLVESAGGAGVVKGSETATQFGAWK